MTLAHVTLLTAGCWAMLALYFFRRHCEPFAAVCAAIAIFFFVLTGHA